MFEKWFKKDGDDQSTTNASEASKDMASIGVAGLDDTTKIEILTNKSAEPTTQEVTDVELMKEEIIQEQPTQLPPLTSKEAKALKKAKYEEIMDNPAFKNSYVLLNKKTGQIVEIKAASSFHACNVIGWKANRVRVLAVNPISNASETSTIDK